MKKYLLKPILAIVIIFGVSMVLAVNQAQSGLIDPARGLYDWWSVLVEYDDAVFKRVEGISEDNFFNIFTIDFVDKTEANISWNLSSLGDNVILEAISVKVGEETYHWLVDSEQRVIGSATISTAFLSTKGISDFRFSVPDATIMWLLGPAFIILGLFGRRRAKA